MKIGILISEYGELPELTLRQGLAMIQEGEVEQLAKNLNNAPALPITNPDSFYDEVSVRLANDFGEDIVERENYRILAQHLEWEDYQLANDLPGEINVHVVDDQLFHVYGLDEAETFLQFDPVEANDFVQGNALYYVEDAPGIFNLNFDVSSEATLSELVGGELNTLLISTLGRQDIAHFRPAVIYTGEFEESVTNFNPNHFSNAGRQLRHAVPNSGDTFSRFTADDDDNENNPPLTVYLIKADSSQ